MRKQVDLIGNIIMTVEKIAAYQNIKDGKVETEISDLSEYIYMTNKPSESQLKSLYRAVTNLENKGYLHSKKVGEFDFHDRRGRWGEWKWGGHRYIKIIYAYIKDGKVVKKC